MNYNGDNPLVKELIRTFKGIAEAFKDLRKEAQKAMFHYMAIDGEAWNNKTLRGAVAEHGDTMFGFVMVPMEELKKAVFDNFKLDDSENKYMNWKDFDAYHNWYMEESRVEDHGDSVWPVIFNSFDDELFQDGWHRFHSYVRAGVKNVPCLYYVK